MTLEKSIRNAAARARHPAKARVGTFGRTNALAWLVASLAMGAATCLPAQSLEQIRSSDKPLVLETVGSFFVGGHPVPQTTAEIGLYGGGQVVVDQMYVQYMVPHAHNATSLVLVHGGTLTGKSYETTPDGRMGWYEYFAREGYPTYVVDQVGRARSGFNQAPFNNVRAGFAPPSSQPNLRRVAADVAWVRFRIGSPNGVAFKDTQFPTEAAGELAKQGVPDLYESMPPNDPNFEALSQLAGMLKHAILIGHSQAGRFPFEAALLNSNGIDGVVAIEPAGCNSQVYTQAQIDRLSKIPILVMFGDHLDAPQTVGVKWNEAYADCVAFVRRVTAAGGNATMLHTVDLGIRGNSHMMMQDRNNLAIAKLIEDWVERLRKRS